MNTDREHMPASLAERLLALTRVGTALHAEQDENRLLHLIAHTACDLTGAAFAAFSLRPQRGQGHPLVPSEGQFFQLAAVVGVTAEQEAFFQQTPLGGEGLLAPIFRQGVPVLVADVLTHLGARDPSVTTRETIVSAREAASAYAQGQLPASALPSLGVPPGHPIVRSFLGAPLLDRTGEVRGGLLVGHDDPGRFTEDDQTLLVSLASQAAVALENARLYRLSEHRAQQLAAIFDSIADGVTLVDGQGTIVRENRAARHLRASLAHSKTAPLIQAFLLSAAAQGALKGERVEQTVEFEHGNQERQTYVVTAQPFRPFSAPSGSLPGTPSASAADLERPMAGAVVVWHDITAARVAASARAASAYAQQLEAIFEVMSDAVFVFDRDGKVTPTNTAAHQHLTRLSPTDYSARPLPERMTQLVLADHQGHPLPPEAWPTTRVLAGELLTQDRPAETSLLTHDGQTLYTQVTGGPFYDGKGDWSGAVLLVRDVTEHKRVEREREQRERERHEDVEAQRELLLLILDELPSSVCLVRGEEARLMLANRAATQLWGAPWPYDQPMQDFLAEHQIRLSGPTGAPLPPERWATLRAVQQGETVRQHQETIRRPNGSTLPVLVNAVALGTTRRLSRLPALLAGSAQGHSEPLALVVHHDVAALKEAESLKDEFIAIAAHELRNPVAVLAGFAQLLVSGTKRGRGPELAAWQQEAIGEIELASARLVTLTEELLDVTRLQAGRLQLHITITDLVALSGRLVARLQRTTERCTLSLQTPAPEVRVMVDAVRIEQVLSNLLTNAIKYSPQGGRIDVRIEEREARQEILLSIRDEGLGIPKDEQAQIFSRFKRATNAQEAGMTGSGLGLYLCRELLALLGGRIWFESVEGAGSTFFVTLPAQRKKK